MTQDIKRQRDLPCSLAQSPDTSLPQNRHAAWIYDVSDSEKIRKSKKKGKKSDKQLNSSRPEQEEDLVNTEKEEAENSGVKFYGPDDSAEPNGDADDQDASELGEDDEQDEPAEDDDADEDEGDDEAAGSKRKRKSSTSEAPTKSDHRPIK